MTKIYRQGAVGALLDVYEKAIGDLQEVIADVSESELTEVVDKETADPNCRSIQAILAHVVRSGYACVIDIRQLKGETSEYPLMVMRQTIQEYLEDLNRVFDVTAEAFKDIPDADIEEFDNARKIHTRWGQIYDIEQMMEHEIVHILRHRRQIEKFKTRLRS